MNSSKISSEIFETALGWIAIAATEHGIVRASLPEPNPDTARAAISDIRNGSLGGPNDALHEAKRPPDPLLQRRIRVTRHHPH